MGFVEIAPNPSGPAHFGSLRTYTLAWLEAQRRGEKLFVRFDATSGIHPTPLPYLSKRWAYMFISDMEEMGLKPDAEEYSDLLWTPDRLPVWAEVRKVGGRGEWAFFPGEPEVLHLPDEKAASWADGKPAPVVRHGDEKQHWWRRVFAQRDAANDGWIVNDVVKNLWRQNYRGTSLIVRSHLNANVRPYVEEPASDYLLLRLPEQILTGVVARPDSALRKSKLQPGDIGTVRWGIDTFGPDALRAAMIESVEEDTAEVISFKRLCERALALSRKVTIRQSKEIAAAVKAVAAIE